MPGGADSDSISASLLRMYFCRVSIFVPGLAVCFLTHLMKLKWRDTELAQTPTLHSLYCLHLLLEM